MDKLIQDQENETGSDAPVSKKSKTSKSSKKELQLKPLRGAIYYNMSFLVQSWYILAMKFIYKRDTTLTWIEMIFYKSCVSMLTLIVIANKDICGYMKVSGPDLKFLVARVLFMVLGLSCLCYASLYVPQTFMGIGQNIAPLLMCLFSRIFLGEIL